MNAKVAPQVVVHKLDEALHEDLKVIKRAVGKMFYREDESATAPLLLDEAKIPEGIGALAYMRDLERQIDKDYKLHTKELDDAIKPFASERRTMKQLIDEMDGQLVSAFTALYKEGKLTNLIGKGGAKLVATKRQEVEINPDELPKSYMKLVPDMDKVNAALAAGEKLKGVAVRTRIIWATKLPDDVEVKS